MFITPIAKGGSGIDEWIDVVVNLGLDPANAVTQALHYTWNTLKHGYRLGMGQHLPDRLYWGRMSDRPRGA